MAENDLARVQIQLETHDGRLEIFEHALSLNTRFTQRLTHEGTLRIFLSAVFSEGATLSAQPAAPAATSVRGYMTGLRSVRFDIDHSIASIDPPCEVSCPQSGERRSGPHPCIECSAGDFVIRICC